MLPRRLVVLSLFSALPGGALSLTPAPARAQIGDYSCEALWHERNSIYARHGYCFKTDRAIAEFGPGCFPPYGRLSGRDADRVNEIQYWERRKDCPR